MDKTGICDRCRKHKDLWTVYRPASEDGATTTSQWCGQCIVDPIPKSTVMGGQGILAEAIIVSRFAVIQREMQRGSRGFDEVIYTAIRIT